MRESPGLERLTRETREVFLTSATDPDFRLRTGGVDGYQPSAALLSYLRREDAFLVEAAIRQLHLVVANFRIRDIEKLEVEARRFTGEMAVPTEIAASLVHFVRWMEWTTVDALVRELLAGYTDADVSVLLLELYRLDYDEFDPNELANGLDFNADDPLPAMCETPHNHLADLILTAVTARLMKNHGRELLIAWAEGSEASIS